MIEVAHGSISNYLCVHFLPLIVGCRCCSCCCKILMKSDQGWTKCDTGGNKEVEGVSFSWERIGCAPFSWLPSSELSYFLYCSFEYFYFFIFPFFALTLTLTFFLQFFSSSFYILCVFFTLLQISFNILNIEEEKEHLEIRKY